MTNQEFRTAALAQLPTFDAKGHPYDNYSDKALLFQLERIDDKLSARQERLLAKKAQLQQSQADTELLIHLHAPCCPLEDKQEANALVVDKPSVIKTVAKASAKVHYAFKTMPWNAIAGNCLLLAVQACYYLVWAIVWTIDLGVRCRKAYEGSQLQATLRTLQALDKAAWDYAAIRRTVRGTYESRLIEELLLGK